MIETEVLVSGAEQIRSLVAERAVLMPGVYDALTARIAARVGFDIVFISGYSVSAARLGEPDFGFLTQTEMAEAAQRYGIVLRDKSSNITFYGQDPTPTGTNPYAGPTGYWEGSYFAGGEGNLRTPCIARWPGHIESGSASDEIMHVTDWFTTILHAADVEPPTDRVIDGIDQLDWLGGKTEASSREGYVYWMGPEIYGVKWRNFKLVLVAQMHLQDAAAKLPTPRLINLTVDPQEREAVPLPHLHTWVASHVMKLIGGFQASTKREPPIPMGAPLEHVPKPSAE